MRNECFETAYCARHTHRVAGDRAAASELSVTTWAPPVALPVAMKLLDVSSCCEIFATRMMNTTGPHDAKSAVFRDALRGRDYVLLQCSKSLLGYVTMAKNLLVVEHLLILIMEGAGIVGAYNKTLGDTKFWSLLRLFRREDALRVFVSFHNTGRLILTRSRLTSDIEREIASRAPGLPVFMRRLRTM